VPSHCNAFPSDGCLAIRVRGEYTQLAGIIPTFARNGGLHLKSLVRPELVAIQTRIEAAGVRIQNNRRCLAMS